MAVSIHIVDTTTDRVVGNIPEDEFWNDERTQELQDTRDTFDFETFSNEPYSATLKARNRILIPDSRNGGYAEFIIDEARQIVDDDGLRYYSVISTGSYLDLRKQKIISPQTIPEFSAAQHVAFAVSGTEWRVGIVDTNPEIISVTVPEHMDSYDYLHHISKRTGMELSFRVVSNGTSVSARYVDLRFKTGKFRGFEARVGYDVQNLERLEVGTDLVTALVGLGPETRDEDLKQMEVYVEDLTAKQIWGRGGANLVAVYTPDMPSQVTNNGELYRLTREELTRRIKVQVQYTATVQTLADAIDVNSIDIQFGDIVRIKDEDFNPPLYLEKRVHTMKGSIKNYGRVEVVLGEYEVPREGDLGSQIDKLKKETDKKFDAIGDTIKDYDGKFDEYDGKFDEYDGKFEEWENGGNGGGGGGKTPIEEIADDRIEARLKFGDDFRGGRFNMTFNSAESRNVKIENGRLTIKMPEGGTDAPEGSEDAPNMASGSLIATGSYGTSGFDKSRMTRLSNGWLAVVATGEAALELHTSKDDGVTWERKFYYNIDSYKSTIQAAITSFGTTVVIATLSRGSFSSSPNRVRVFVMDAIGDYPVSYKQYQLTDSSVVTGLFGSDSIDVIMSDNEQTINIVWSAFVGRHDDSTTIKQRNGYTYTSICKGFLSSNNDVTWEPVERLTENTAGVHYANAKVIVDDEGALIIFLRRLHYTTTSTSGAVIALRRRGLPFSGGNGIISWSWVNILPLKLDVGANLPGAPDAVFIPPFVSAKPKGRIYVVTSSVDGIILRYSDDTGVSWSDSIVVDINPSAYENLNPAITADISNRVHIVWEHKVVSAYTIKTRTFYNGSLSPIKALLPTTAKPSHPSTLKDLSRIISFPPIAIQMTTFGNYRFYGSWSQYGVDPSEPNYAGLRGTAVYDLPAGISLGALVEVSGTMYVNAFVNGEDVSEAIYGGEFQFEHSSNASGPLKLKLVLSRLSTRNGDNDAVTQIIGGID